MYLPEGLGVVTQIVVQIFEQIGEGDDEKDLRSHKTHYHRIISTYYLIGYLEQCISQPSGLLVEPAVALRLF